DALPHRFAGELLVAQRRVDLALARVEHLHVAAQRNRGDAVFRAIAADALPDRAAEADREAQHLDPTAARDPVVAKFMEGHQHAERDQQPEHRAEKGSHQVPGWKVIWTRISASIAQHAPG